jgi:hypothetical protein
MSNHQLSSDGKQQGIPAISNSDDNMSRGNYPYNLYNASYIGSSNDRSNSGGGDSFYMNVNNQG